MRKPITAEFANKVLSIWKNGSKATARPATPPERILYGKIKNSTDIDNKNVPAKTIKKLITLFLFMEGIIS